MKLPAITDDRRLIDCRVWADSTDSAILNHGARSEETETVTTTGYCPSKVGLDRHGIRDAGEVYWNLSPAELNEHAIRNGEGSFAANGAIVCTTGVHTGRSPKDKFIVQEDETKSQIWWGPVNQPISEENFEALHQKILAHYRGRNLYVRDMFAGADEATRIPIRVVTETAWHNLFASQLFIKPDGTTEGQQNLVIAV